MRILELREREVMFEVQQNDKGQPQAACVAKMNLVMCCFPHLPVVNKVLRF